MIAFRCISQNRVSIELKSDLSLVDLAQTISEKIFLGAEFGNQNEHLCNEDPSVFFVPS